MGPKRHTWDWLLTMMHWMWQTRLASSRSLALTWHFCVVAFLITWVCLNLDTILENYVILLWSVWWKENCFSRTISCIFPGKWVCLVLSDIFRLEPCPEWYWQAWGFALLCYFLVYLNFLGFFAFCMKNDCFAGHVKDLSVTHLLQDSTCETHPIHANRTHDWWQG